MIARLVLAALVLAALCGLSACAEERVITGPCVGEECTAHVHPLGILDRTSDDFHGRELARRNWDFKLCAGCHGDNFDGGKAEKSCRGCHAEGPTACTTCHGTGPTSNAHKPHASNGVMCADCHVVPTAWDTEGHILKDGVAITTPPAIVFSARAAQTLDPNDRAGAPSWDGATCKNVYCHGDVLHAGGGLAPEPRWDDPTPGTCARCHGTPPPSHSRNDCATCHPAGAPHIDGKVQIGRTTGCDGCHGSAASPAPPTDLSGNTFTSAIGVGAHQAHLQGTSRLAAPVPCATCHVVPATVTAAGHLDPGPAEVTASLGWDRAAQTCTTSYCHGAARPIWTAQGQAYCGTCHGVPPTTPSHNPTMTLTSCAGCHPRTVDAFGNILVTNGSSEHINGHVDSP